MQLIKYVNAADVGLKVFYSTPSCYLKSKHEENPKLEEKNEDFFPYADGAHMFWTGYFTSRAALKEKFDFYPSKEQNRFSSF